MAFSHSLLRARPGREVARARLRAQGHAHRGCKAARSLHGAPQRHAAGASHDPIPDEPPFRSFHPLLLAELFPRFLPAAPEPHLYHPIPPGNHNLHGRPFSPPPQPCAIPVPRPAPPGQQVSQLSAAVPPRPLRPVRHLGGAPALGRPPQNIHPLVVILDQDQYRAGRGQRGWSLEGVRRRWRGPREEGQRGACIELRRIFVVIVGFILQAD